MTAHMPRFHDFDDMKKGRRTKLSSTISFLSMPLEHVFFVLKPDQHHSSSSIAQFPEEAIDQRPENTQNPSTQEGFISRQPAFHQRDIATPAS
jgi:hypothetical protein